jgi:hypothetical protein
MKTFAKSFAIIIVALIFSFAVKAQTSTTSSNDTTMKTYLIERQIPDAGKLTPEQLKAISQKSCSVLREMGPKIEWVQSYVTGDKIYCVYKAQNEELLKEHASKGGFPINHIYQIATVISPATAQ